MNYYDIVCLAKSRKLNGHCIAGKHPQQQAWMRPVSSHLASGELYTNEIICSCGNEVQLLDIVRIPIGISKARPYHPEDISVRNGKWSRIGRLDLRDLARLCDNPSNLWLIEGQPQDRIPIPTIQETGIGKSLALIRTQGLKLETCYSFSGKRQLRAKINYLGRKYNFVVTDRQYENAYRSKGIGEYDLSGFNFFLCISLSEPLYGHCYKLVASIFCIETYPSVVELCDQDEYLPF